MPRYIVEVNFFVEATDEDAATKYVQDALTRATVQQASPAGSAPAPLPSFTVAWTEDA